MRALVLLFLGVLCLWAVLKFYPRSETGAAESGGTAGADPAAVPAGDPQAEQGGQPAQPGRPARDPDHQSSPVAAEPDPVILGGLLVHGRAPDVRRYLDESGVGLASPRARLALAFAEAADGNRGRGAELAEGLWDSGACSALDLELLRRALGQAPSRTLPAAAVQEDALTRGLLMALTERQARAQIDAGDLPAAALLYSDILLAEVEAPWKGDGESLDRWTQALRRAQRGHRWNPRGEWHSMEVEVQPGDSLTAIRKRVIEEMPGLLINTGLIARVNRAENRYLQAGEILRIPTDPVSIVVDLDARWLLYLHGDEVVAAWEVGVGAQGSETYLGTFWVGEKLEQPMWFPGPGHEPLPFGHPENPLGTRWITWTYEDGTKTTLGFHGTDEPETMGQAISAGCIRMRNEDVEELFEIIPRGSQILVRT